MRGPEGGRIIAGLEEEMRKVDTVFALKQKTSSSDSPKLSDESQQLLIKEDKGIAEAKRASNIILDAHI